ncbi:MAG: hypothetical protein LQ338_005832 [Usnochroma carphineum]|nr:MAG: hypothetical protein LQ338_005832 [Usnochroma carphineum]
MWHQDPDVSDALATLKQRLSREALNEPESRRNLMDAARSLSNHLETPGEYVQRVAYLDSLFEWFPKHPTNHEAFMLWMTAQREGRDRWLDIFPFTERIADGFRNDPEAVMLVDVEGGIGHEIQAIKQYYPSLPGRFILQDTPETLKRALAVESMEYNFFTEQPVTDRFQNDVRSGAEERSGGQWRSMLDEAGFRVVKIWTRAQEAESTIEAELM